MAPSPHQLWATPVRGWGGGSVLFFHWIRWVPCSLLGIQAGLKDRVVHKALTQTISPVAQVATVGCHLALPSWHLLQLHAVGIVCGVSSRGCLSTPSMLLCGIPLPSVEFPLQTSLQLSRGNALTLLSFPYSAVLESM